MVAIGDVLTKQAEYFGGLAFAQFPQAALARDQRSEIDFGQRADAGLLQAQQGGLGRGTERFRAADERGRAAIEGDPRTSHRGVGGVCRLHRGDSGAGFDIYLPEWLARYNKQIFGPLYVAGVVYALVRYLGLA